MSTSYVYKITRSDDLEYIGITVDLNKRMTAHAKSERFATGIKNVEVLAECNTYDLAERLEEFFIKKFNTFENGLNKSIDGKGNHLSDKFSTYGMKYSDESKQKMKDNHWSKHGGQPWNKDLNDPFSEETKAKWSKNRKGYTWAPRKVSIEDGKRILNEYKNDELEFDVDFISKYVKATQRDSITNIPFKDLKSPNGKPLNKLTLYAAYYSERLGVSSANIRNILNGKYQFAEHHENR